MNTETRTKDCSPETSAERSRTLCGPSGRTRPRYYRGMLLDESDLVAEQCYQDGLRRKLARLMHGCGILCGLEMRVEERCGKPALVVCPGLALDDDGRLVEVPETIVVRLRDLCRPDKESGRCDDRDRTPRKGRYCVMLRHSEFKTDRETAYLPGMDECGSICEYARVEEGWCLELVPDDGRCPARACCDAAPRRVLCSLDELCDPQACCEERCSIVLGCVELDCECDELCKVADSDRRRRYAWTARRLDRLLEILCSWRASGATPASPTSPTIPPT